MATLGARVTALGLGTLSREELLQLVADEAWTNDRFRSRVSMAVAQHSQDLFASPHSSKVRPTETEQLMMVSKIGSWLAEQPKQA